MPPTRPASRSRRVTYADALALERELGVSPRWRRCSSGAGSASRGGARVPGRRARRSRPFAGIRPGRDLILRMSATARASRSTATTTSTASARRRSSSARCARWAPTSTGSCPAGRGRLRPGDGDRRAAGRARHEAAGHRRLRDHRGRRGRRGARRGARRRGHRPPRAARRRRAARRADRAPADLRLPVRRPLRRRGRATSSRARC